jgi:uncharacterized protein (DUF488 family)
MAIYTIGFTRKSAEQFFGLLNDAGIKRVLDIRLNNTSQLAAFTRRDDLAYFLRELCDAEYHHELQLAPTQDILTPYRATSDWEAYKAGYAALLAERRPEMLFPPEYFALPTALLCAEPTAEHCHRRLAAEYLAERLGEKEIIHL